MKAAGIINTVKKIKGHQVHANAKLIWFRFYMLECMCTCMYVFVVSEHACVSASARDRVRRGEKFQMLGKYTVPNHQ